MRSASTRRSILFGTLLVLIFLLSLAFTRSGHATLGNVGVPVRCLKVGGEPIPPNTVVFLNCFAADGTSFPDGQRVPASRYLLVTDIVITPDAGTNTTALTDVRLFDAYGTDGRNFAMRFRGTTSASYGEHYTVPFMVLPADHRIEVSTNTFNTAWVEVRVSGLLVTNVSYLPLISQG